MKRRIKKDNERRESLNIPVPESEVVEVAESDTEKDDEGKAAKDEKAKEEGSKAEHHSRRDERSPDRRRTSPRRRISPQRYRPYVASMCYCGTNFFLPDLCWPCCRYIFLFSTSNLASYLSFI